ncbi:MAG: hypothetical protein Q6373_015425, partial [Candidatus Sigynarchaeota archaeon]
MPGHGKGLVFGISAGHSGIDTDILRNVDAGAYTMGAWVCPTILTGYSDGMGYPVFNSDKYLWGGLGFGLM